MSLAIECGDAARVGEGTHKKGRVSARPAPAPAPNDPRTVMLKFNATIMANMANDLKMYSPSKYVPQLSRLGHNASEKANPNCNNKA